MKDLKEKTFVGLCERWRTGSRFSSPLGFHDGIGPIAGAKGLWLLGMVTAFTGVLSLFRDFGLSAAAVQRATVTEEQTSTLFWINVLFGAGLTIIAVLLAPVVAIFYHEPRLFWVTCIVATGFLFNSTGVQTFGYFSSVRCVYRFGRYRDRLAGGKSVIAIGAAKMGYGYWSLVAMSVSLPLTFHRLFVAGQCLGSGKIPRGVAFLR